MYEICLETYLRALC